MLSFFRRWGKRSNAGRVARQGDLLPPDQKQEMFEHALAMTMVVVQTILRQASERREDRLRVSFEDLELTGVPLTDADLVHLMRRIVQKGHEHGYMVAYTAHGGRMRSVRFVRRPNRQAA